MRLLGKARSLWDRLLGSAWVPLERAEARMGRPADQLPREYCRATFKSPGDMVSNVNASGMIPS